MTYLEKLQHPNWQRKRLQVMERDNFTCQLCKDKETTLNVHHKLYKRGDVWDYEDNELITYCKVCHAVVEYTKKIDKDIIILDISKSQHLEINGITMVIMFFKSKQGINVGILNFHKINNEIEVVTVLSKESINNISENLSKFIN